MIIYAAVPYLLAAAPPLILLLSILVGSCTMMRPGAEAMDRTHIYADANSRAGEELVRELDRRAARAELRHVMEETQR